mgnify:CR=1 FL=1|jgi:hypothetical protein
MGKFFVLFLYILSCLSLIKVGEGIDIECLKSSTINKAPSSELEKIINKDIRGNWAKLSDIKNKKINQCDKKVINFLLKSENYFINLEAKEFDCQKRRSKILCEEILIDECCILKWRQEELEGWKKKLE